MGLHWPKEEDVFSSLQENQGDVAMIKKMMVLSINFSLNVNHYYLDLMFNMSLATALTILS